LCELSGRGKWAYKGLCLTLSEGNGLLGYWNFQLEKLGILVPGEMEAAQLHWRDKFEPYMLQKQIFNFQLSYC
jgi:hypothetical protein